MNAKLIESKFAAMGARFVMQENPENRSSWARQTSNYAVDIGHDRQGQFYELRLSADLRENLEVTVLQVEPKNRHLLLFVRNHVREKTVDRFLCGHDEREWFVAAVPGNASTVRSAFEALQPPAVRAALARTQVSSKLRFARKNRAFRRQGEWFFVPQTDLVVNEKLILRNEPIRRGSGKPHMVENLYRTGGETVYVSGEYPNGLTEPEYNALIRRAPLKKRMAWRVMRRNAGVFARGAIRHPDHATIVLNEWHMVVMNRETESRTMAQVAFLD